jgi:hypothetical protein
MKNLVADRTDIQGHRTGAFGGESVSGKGHPALRDDLPHQRGREEPGPPSTARTASAPPVGPPSAELAESGDRAVAFSPLVERPWFRCPSSPDRRNDVARHRVVACALAQAVALIIVAASMPVAASPAVAATGDATGGVVRHIEWGPCPVELPTRRDVDCGSLLVPEVRRPRLPHRRDGVRGRPRPRAVPAGSDRRQPRGQGFDSPWVHPTASTLPGHPRRLLRLIRHLVSWESRGARRGHAGWVTSPYPVGRTRATHDGGRAEPFVDLRSPEEVRHDRPVTPDGAR